MYRIAGVYRMYRIEDIRMYRIEGIYRMYRIVPLINGNDFDINYCGLTSSRSSVRLSLLF
jgi:hypothetical protein